jgi:Ser/Thr protein kinase RdoA (MazF antagonist)
MTGGRNNRLFLVEMADARRFVAKFYHQDRWDRLGHEFQSLSFLNNTGVQSVPQAYLRSDAFVYGVYSFEPGAPKPAEHFQEAELVKAAELAARLHDATMKQSLAEEVPTAIGAAFSIAEQLQVIDARLRDFESFATGALADPDIRAIHRQLDLRAAIAALLARGTGELDNDTLTTSVSRSQWRLNTTDFGPHNLLVAEDGRITAIDFEGAGWDDPARLVMVFVSHASTESLSPTQTRCFLAAYADARGLSQAEVERFERIGWLCDVEWVAIYATALTAEAVAAKQLADPDFDPQRHRREVLAKLKRRITRADARTGYRFA